MDERALERRLTFYQASHHIECDNHTAHPNECLPAAPKKVEAVASPKRNGKRPTAYDDIDLGLSFGVGDAGLIQDFVQVESGAR